MTATVYLGKNTWKHWQTNRQHCQDVSEALLTPGTTAAFRDISQTVEVILGGISWIIEMKCSHWYSLETVSDERTFYIYYDFINILFFQLQNATRLNVMFDVKLESLSYTKHKDQQTLPPFLTSNEIPDDLVGEYFLLTLIMQNHFNPEMLYPNISFNSMCVYYIL